MIHVLPLPGTPKASLPLSRIVEFAIKEATVYKSCGVDAVAIENMHDIPYLNGAVGPEIVASMSVIAREVKKVLQNIPVGIQILAAANKEAMAVANAAGLDFIRAEGFVFSHVADEGTMNSCAGELLRYRKQIGADNVLVFTDIKKKHSSHAITADVSIGETASAAEFFLSDGVIITGKATGLTASIDEITEVKNSTKLPVLVGSGVTEENVGEYLSVADGVIVGSYFKEGGKWQNAVSDERVVSFMKKVKQIRGH